MSVTVADLLCLPCLREARVAAGHGGLGRIVTSVSVLEYSEPGALQNFLSGSREWSGGELVISGFVSVKDDVAAQCANTRWMAEQGEVGLVLYYVGVFLPKVDQRLTALCDELDFPLIVMPENHPNLRYSELICEAMEVIFKDKGSNTYMVGDILDRVSRLPEHQRSINTVLKMLSDYIHASAVLADGTRQVLNIAAWPRNLGLNLEKVLGEVVTLPETGGAPTSLCLLEQNFLLYRCPMPESLPSLELFLFKEGEPLNAETVRQAGELVCLGVNIWSRGHAQTVVSELVRAILKDEPIKMRRLAEIFHVDVASIHSMWLVPGDSEHQEVFRERVPGLVQELLAPRCKTVVADLYQGDLVAFMDWSASAGDGGELASALAEQLRGVGLSTPVVRCHDLVDTAAVRQAHLAIQKYLPDAREIWPGREWYTLKEVEFAGDCRRTIEAGETALQAGLSPIRPLEGEGGELWQTLAVYLLDTQSSVTQAAERQFLHKNTIKYRLSQIGLRLGYRVGKMPETFALYTACGLRRLLES